MDSHIVNQVRDLYGSQRAPGALQLQPPSIESLVCSLCRLFGCMGAVRRCCVYY